MAETIWPASDETLKATNEAIGKTNDLLSIIARNTVIDTDIDWAGVRALVSNGMASQLFSVGDQLVVPWTDQVTGTSYDIPFDIVHFGNIETEDGMTKPGMFLQAHYTLPFATMFDQREAFYVAPAGGLAAGTYNVIMGYTQGTLVTDTAYQFTLTQALPEGGQLAGFNGAWDTDPSTWVVYAYASASTTTAIETCTVTQGSEGTNLGTFLRTVNGDLGSLQCAAYGNNTWETSNLRQWLNSNAAASAWFTAQHSFDRAPDYLTKAGFMTGFDAAFLNVLGAPKMVTAKNYITEGGSSTAPETSITYDKFFLPSNQQHWIACNESSVDDLEGEGWEYWREVAGSDTRLALWQTYPQFITYAINAKTSAQTVWLRSASRGGACGVFLVSSSGNVYTSTASNGNRCAPACVVC